MTRQSSFRLLWRHTVQRRFSSRPAAAVDDAARFAAAEVAAAGPSGWTAAGAAGAGRSLAERYAALVASGMLRPDPHQEAVVQRLHRLSQDLVQHSQQVEAHRQRTAAYAQRRAALQLQLLPAEEARLLAEEDAAAADAASRLGSMRSWLSAALGAEEQAAGQQPQKRSPAQRRAVARARVERQLDEQLGPPPPPPAPPKGGYLM